MNVTPSAIQNAPTLRERRSLAVALGVLGVVFAVIVWSRPEGLLILAWASGLAWCARLLFHRAEPQERRLLGGIVPLVAGAVYLLVRDAPSPTAIAVGVAGACALLGTTVWSSARFGSWFHGLWTLLFMPLAWGVSTALLVMVYYGVLTPIGLMLCLAGRDPLHRRFDRQAASYWVKRRATDDPEHYFRQF